MERNTRTKMIGEALREAGVLVVVFSLLDYVFADRQTPPPSIESLVTVLMIIGLGFWVAGMAIEEKRQ